MLIDLVDLDICFKIILILEAEFISEKVFSLYMYLFFKYKIHIVYKSKYTKS